jgi:hypothetical protein
MTTEKAVPTKAPVRPKRKPVGTRERINIINQEPDRAYRLINADPERMATFEEAGYRIEPINKHILGGQRTDVPTPIDNTLAVGLGHKQVLVSIEREFYEEDQAEKQALVDAKEAGIKQPSEEQYGRAEIKHEARRKL